MSTLDQDLVELRERLEALPDALLGLFHDAGRLAQAATGLSEQLRAARGDAERSTAGVRSAGDRMEAATDALQDALRASTEPPVAAWEEGSGAFQDAERALLDAAGSARSEAEACGAGLRELVGGWSEAFAGGAVDDATDRVVDAARATAARLEAVAQEHVVRMGDLEAAAGAAVADVNAAATALAYAGTEAAAHARERAVGIVGPFFAHLMDEHAAARAAATAELRTQAARLLRETGAALDASVREPVANATQAAAADLMALAEAASATARALPPAAEAVLDGLYALGEAAAPIAGVDARVQEAVTRISASGRAGSP